MSDLEPIVDDDLEVDRKRNFHKRNEKINEHVATLTIITMWVCAIAVFASVFYGVYLYLSYLNNPQSVDTHSIEIITSIFTHSVGVIGGYLAHFFKRNIPK